MQPAPIISSDFLLEQILKDQGGGRRLIAIAGPPGSGKSTLAEMIVDAANARHSGYAALLPMDGYHFDDTLLDQLGRKARKGAPDTFDVGGLNHMLARLHTRAEDYVAVPVFDRYIEIARAGARLIPRSIEVIVVEGNYLLLDRDPWRQLRAHFNLAVLVEVSEDVLRERLSRRWDELGLPAEVTRAKVEENDLPNGKVVMEMCVRPDFRIAGI